MLPLLQQTRYQNSFSKNCREAKVTELTSLVLQAKHAGAQYSFSSVYTYSIIRAEPYCWLNQGLPFTSATSTCYFVHCSSVALGSHWLVEEARLVHHLHDSKPRNY
jgi:hypothetical protein